MEDGSSGDGKPGVLVAPALSSGLGNRLFQYAAAAGAAERWGARVVFTLDACSESPHGSIATLFRMYPTVRVLKRGVWTGFREENRVELREEARGFYRYTPLPVAVFRPRVLIQGFRQSPRYFPTNLAVLRPDWDSALGGEGVRESLEASAGLLTEAERRQTVALHVRLGDYRKLPHHQEDLEIYYRTALKKVRPDQRILLFSDEPDLCQGYVASLLTEKGLVAGARPALAVAKVRSDVESLYEMSLCWGGTICANSTFSWWGAWFAHDGSAAAAAAAADHWATMPSRWGRGQPPPVDVAPPWAEVISVD